MIGDRGKGIGDRGKGIGANATSVASVQSSKLQVSSFARYRGNIQYPTLKSNVQQLETRHPVTTCLKADYDYDYDYD